jgi:hypothetical protein
LCFSYVQEENKGYGVERHFQQYFSYIVLDLMTVNVQVELKDGSGVGIMVFNATFNNFSVILRQSMLLVEETGVLGENH